MLLLTVVMLFTVIIMPRHAAANIIHAYYYNCLTSNSATIKTSVQGGAVLMPLAMFLLSLTSIRKVNNLQ